jgi:hypothetical protein
MALSHAWNRGHQPRNTPARCTCLQGLPHLSVQPMCCRSFFLFHMLHGPSRANRCEGDQDTTSLSHRTPAINIEYLQNATSGGQHQAPWVACKFGHPVRHGHGCLARHHQIHLPLHQPPPPPNPPSALMAPMLANEARGRCPRFYVPSSRRPTTQRPPPAGAPSQHHR